MAAVIFAMLVFFEDAVAQGYDYSSPYDQPQSYQPRQYNAPSYGYDSPYQTRDYNHPRTYGYEQQDTAPSSLGSELQPRSRSLKQGLHPRSRTLNLD